MPTTSIVRRDGDRTVTSHVNGLPKHHDKATTYGAGERKSFVVKSGAWKGLRVGGGTRPQVYGNTFHRSVPSAGIFPWGFIPLDVSLDAPNADLSSYNKSIPQNISRPGGQLSQFTIWPINITITGGSIFSPNRTVTKTINLPFFFVSDLYTAGQVHSAVYAKCGDVLLNDTIPFNSTRDMRPGSVVQFYRGESAAIILQGYDNAEAWNNLSSVPNPPFPPNVSTSAWSCLNLTVGDSIPLMGSPGRSSGEKLSIGLGTALATVGGLWVLFICYSRILRNKRTKDYDSLRRRSVPGDNNTNKD